MTEQADGRDALYARLAADRRTAQHRIDDLAHLFDAIVESSRDVATDDEHDPEGHTIAYERAQVATLVAQAREQLAALDRAVERIDAGDYGRCERCGERIAAERLVARPAATECVACASQARR